MVCFSAGGSLERMMDVEGVKSWFQHVSGAMRLLWLVAGGGLTLGSLLGCFGLYSWVLDAFSHFRVQYAVGSVVLIPLTLFCRYYWVSAGLTVVALFNAVFLLPLFLGEPSFPSQEQPTHRVLLSNVHTANTNYEAVLALIKQFDPELIVLEEVNHDWMTHLAPLWSAYPFVTAAPREDNFGIAFLSKVKPENSRIEYVGAADVPTVVADLQYAEGRLTLVGTHPLPPIGRTYWASRNEQLQVLSAFLPGVGNPILLVGDLNMSPWSFFFHDFVERTQLVDCTKGRGLQPTWPVFQPLYLIPLDHCLHSPAIRVVNKQVGPDVSSDHYPIIVDFQLPVLPTTQSAGRNI